MHFLLLLVLFFSACATSGDHQLASYPKAPTEAQRKSFSVAEQMYQQRKWDLADFEFSQYIQIQEHSELTDHAYFYRGEIAFVREQFADALEQYRQSYTRYYSPVLTPRAQFKAALALKELKRCGSALDELRKIKRKDASANLRLRADSLAWFCANQENYAVPAITWALFALDDYQQLTQADVVRLQSQMSRYETLLKEDVAQTEVDQWMKQGQLELAQLKNIPLAEMEGKKSGMYALWQQAQALYHSGKQNEAEEVLSRYVGNYAKGPYYAEASKLLHDIRALAGSQKEIHIKIGALLPLSGKFQTFGESVLHGMQCAGGQFSPCLGPQGVEIIAKDSGSTAAQAIQAIKELDEAEVSAIVGPMISVIAEDAAKAAQERGIPIITLAQREGLAEIGEYVFRNIITPRSEVNTLVDYSVNQKKLRTFFILHPKNPIGKYYAELFTKAVSEAGGKVVGSKEYSQNDVNLMNDVGYLSNDGKFPVGSKKSYDAIFLPDSPWIVGIVGPSLSMKGLTNVKLLGTSRWDNPQLLERGGKFIDGAVYVTGFSLLGKDPLTVDFSEQFQAAFKQRPTLLEALGYDSVRILLESAEKSSSRRGALKDKLMESHDWQGVTGNFHFDASGDAERSLKLMGVQKGSVISLQE